MPFIELPLGIRVALEYEVFGKVVVNVYHVTTTEPIITIKLLDIAEVFEAWWLDSMSDLFSEDIALTTVTALDLSQVNGEKQTLVVSPPLPGLLLNEAVTNNVAVVASLATAKTGRSFRGRSYHAGMNTLQLEENHIPSARAASMVLGYGELITALGLEASVLVVASFQSENEPRVVGVATPVDSVSVNTRVDTQRRRLPKT